MAIKDKELTFLFIGDIVARPGRQIVKELLPSLKEELRIDVVIANAENLAGGKGITNSTIYEMISAGVDVFTGGNHIFFQDESEELLNDNTLNIIRPANYPEAAGRGFLVYEHKDKKILVINIEGQASMNNSIDNPFFTVDEIVKEHSREADLIVVDFHAELTSEKRAMGYFVDGAVTACIGTHTHVPTADAQILPKGTFYITDAGMSGNADSVLGVKKDIIIDRFMSPTPKRFVWEYDGQKTLNAILFKTDKFGKVVEFRRIDQLIA